MGVKPSAKLYCFHPDEDAKVLARGTKYWQRLIFDNNEEYYDLEEERYEEFMDYIEEQGITFPPMVQK